MKSQLLTGAALGSDPFDAMLQVRMPLAMKRRLLKEMARYGYRNLGEYVRASLQMGILFGVTPKERQGFASLEMRGSK